MIIDKKNGTVIRKVIKFKYNNVNMNIKTIFKFMNYIWKAIASHIKHIYQTEHIATLNGNESYSIDESLMAHEKQTQIWVVGVIKNSYSNNMRLNLTKIRNNTILKRFVEGYVKKRIIIVIDRWLGYSFINQANSGYQHLSFNHGYGLFGKGINTTSHTESFWAFLKSTLKKIYYSICSKNLIFFLKDTEPRHLLREKK